MFTTKVGRFDVPVRDANMPTLMFFEAGVHGKGFGERGVFQFWTVVLKNGKRTWGRSMTVLPVADRFTRMEREMKTAPSEEARKHYAQSWKAMKRGAAIAYFRPTTRKELEGWLRSHQTDAIHAKWYCLNGTLYPVRNVATAY
jgi:hypothetical protein